MIMVKINVKVTPKKRECTKLLKKKFDHR